MISRPQQATDERRGVAFVGFVLGHGGDAMQMLDLAHGMHRRGEAVRIVVPRIDTTVEFAAECARRGVPVERSGLIRADLDGVRQRPLDLLRLLAGTRREVVHFHTGDVFLPRLVSFAMATLRAAPAVATVHSPWDKVDAGPRGRRWRRFVQRHLVAVVCPSEHGRQIQLDHGVAPERVRTIYNCIDLERFGGGVAANAFTALGLPASAQLIVFTSRLDEQKRPIDAVEAFVRVARDRPAAHLVFVGRGGMEEDVRAAAARSEFAHRIHFAGFQPRVEDWLAAATAWILPTSNENFSIALLEALAAGCAMVTTNCRGNDEVLVHDDNAIVTDVGDVAAQAAGLASILDDPQVTARLAAGARATSRRFGVDTMVDEYATVYELARSSASRRRG